MILVHVNTILIQQMTVIMKSTSCGATLQDVELQFVIQQLNYTKGDFALQSLILRGSSAFGFVALSVILRRVWPEWGEFWKFD